MKQKATLKSLLLLIAVLAMTVFTLRAEQDDLSWMRGVNFVPSYAKNSVQLWLEYDPAVIDRELAFAQKLKLNTVRIFLHVAVFEKQPEKLLADFENFLTLADKHGLKVMPVLFDNCFDPQEVDISTYKDKMWIPSPGFPRLGAADRPAIEKYISAVVGKYREDKRIVLWDVMNEPDITKYFREESGKKQVVDFLRWAIPRVKEEKPSQPLGVGWAQAGRIELTADLVDVLVMHCYDGPKGLGGNIRRVKELGTKLNKPLIINEFAGRLTQPLERALPVVAKEKIGWCFWELMIGKTQFSQGRIPYQGHIYPDGTCFSAEEVATILNPGGYQGDPVAIAREAGFEISDKIPKPFTEESLSFTPNWSKKLDPKVPGGRYWMSSMTGDSVTKEVTGSNIEVALLQGIGGGIASVTIDGNPAQTPEIDTFSKEEQSLKKTLVAQDLPPGKHTVVVKVTGRQTENSRNCILQFVDITAQ